MHKNDYIFTKHHKYNHYLIVIAFLKPTKCQT